MPTAGPGRVGEDGPAFGLTDLRVSLHVVNKIYILDKVEDNGVQISGHPARGSIS